MVLMILYCSLLAFGSLAGVLLINKYFKKYFDKYYLRIIFGVLVLGYLVIVRFIPTWKQISFFNPKLNSRVMRWKLSWLLLFRAR